MASHQGSQSLGEHAAEGSATGVGCRPKWIGNEAASAPAAATPGPACRPGTGPPRSSGWDAWRPRRAVGRPVRGGTGALGAGSGRGRVPARRRPSSPARPAVAAAGRRHVRPRPPASGPARPCSAQTPWVDPRPAVRPPAPGRRPAAAGRSTSGVAGGRLPLPVQRLGLRPVGDARLGPTGTPISSTTVALPVSGLPPLPAAGSTSPCRWSVGATAPAAAGRRLHHRPRLDRRPVRCLPVGRLPGAGRSWSTPATDQASAAFTTHLVYTEAGADHPAAPGGGGPPRPDHPRGRPPRPTTAELAGPAVGAACATAADGRRRRSTGTVDRHRRRPSDGAGHPRGQRPDRRRARPTRATRRPSTSWPPWPPTRRSTSSPRPPSPRSTPPAWSTPAWPIELALQVARGVQIRGRTATGARSRPRPAPARTWAPGSPTTASIRPPSPSCRPTATARWCCPPTSVASSPTNGSTAEPFRSVRRGDRSWPRWPPTPTSPPGSPPTPATRCSPPTSWWPSWPRSTTRSPTTPPPAVVAVVAPTGWSDDPDLRRHPARRPRRQPDHPAGHHRRRCSPPSPGRHLPRRLPARRPAPATAACRSPPSAPSASGSTGFATAAPARPAARPRSSATWCWPGESEHLRPAQQSAVLANAGGGRRRPAGPAAGGRRPHHHPDLPAGHACRSPSSRPPPTR